MTHAGVAEASVLIKNGVDVNADALVVSAETVQLVRKVGSGNAADLPAYVVEKDKTLPVVAG
jgi:hypothetical protein